MVREIIDIDTNYMEDDESNSEKSKKNDEKDTNNSNDQEGDNKKMPMMNLIQLWPQWKTKLNRKFYKQFII